MKFLLTLTITIMLFGSLAHSRIHAVLISATKTVALAATPEPLAGVGVFSDDLIVQAKTANTQPVFFGPCSGTQDIELAAGASIGISEITSVRSEVGIDLNKICLKVSVNGEAASILYTKVVSQ